MYKAHGQLNKEDMSDLSPVQVMETKHAITIEDRLANQDIPKKQRKRPHFLLAICVLLLIIGTGAAIIFGRWENGSVAVDDLTSLSVTVNINSSPQTIMTNCTTVGELLSEHGIRLTEFDYIGLEMDEPLYDGMNIWLRLAVNITIEADGRMYNVHSQPITVKEALLVAGVEIDSDDKISLPLLSYLYEDTDIVVERVWSEEDIVNEDIPYDTELREFSYLAPGSTTIIRAGQTGVSATKYSVKYCGDAIISRVLVGSEIIQQPTTEIIGFGPRASDEAEETDTENKIESAVLSESWSGEIIDNRTGQIAGEKTGNIATTEDGAEFYYTKMMTVEATAYSWTGENTATGTVPAIGTIAVDPSVIPLGTKVYVVGYGFATAEDTGGAIKGNIIDLYMDTEEDCVEWGRQNVTIYILEE